jgi:hypothetical protein
MEAFQKEIDKLFECPVFPKFPVDMDIFKNWTFSNFETVRIHLSNGAYTECNCGEVCDSETCDYKVIQNVKKAGTYGSKYFVTLDVLAELSRRSTKHEGFRAYLLDRLKQVRKGKRKPDNDLDFSRDLKIRRITKTTTREEAIAMLQYNSQTVTLLQKFVDSKTRGEAIRKQLEVLERQNRLEEQILADVIAQRVVVLEHSSKSLFSTPLLHS